MVVDDEAPIRDWLVYCIQKCPSATQVTSAVNGDEAYRMGNIWDGVTNTDMQEKFRQCNVYSRRECDDCWARLYCSGGCAANAYHASGDINGVYEYGCELFRKRMECAIMLKIAERGIS